LAVSNTVCGEPLTKMGRWMMSSFSPLGMVKLKNDFSSGY